jgi:hypothetical protein
MTAVLELGEHQDPMGAVRWAAPRGMSLGKNGTDRLTDRCGRV